MWAGLLLLKIENWFSCNNSRTTVPGMMKLHMWMDLSRRKVPNDFGQDRCVGGACVTKNRNTVSAQYLQKDLVWNDETRYEDGLK